MEKKKNNIKNKYKVMNIYKVLFLISLLVYIYGFIMSIYFGVVGINTKNLYLGESIKMNTFYGYEASRIYIVDYIVYIFYRFWFIPLYQIIYILFKIRNNFRIK